MSEQIICLLQGYGGFLTKLYFQNGIIHKKSLNEHGDVRIKNEMNFYNFANATSFSRFIPKILSFSDNSFDMEYLNDYTTLEIYFRNYINNSDNSDVILSTIQKINNILDKNLYTDKVLVELNEFEQNIFLETTGKVLSRIQSVRSIIEKYNYVSTVNGVETMKLDKIIEKIDKYINNYLKSCEFNYYPIHGDLQLNNILINHSTNDIKFIDPRGYFGNSKIFGMKEYDLAKLYFGLSGYSYFDLKNVTELNIIDKNIYIDMKEMVSIFELPTIVQMFIICIWLGNSHCFINNEFKVIESYFYSLYISTLCLNKII